MALIFHQLFTSKKTGVVDQQLLLFALDPDPTFPKSFYSPDSLLYANSYKGHLMAFHSRPNL
jgi:hypothetical protein